MAEVVIGFVPPPSLNEEEMYAWVADRAGAQHRALALSAPECLDGSGLRLRVEIDDGASDAGAEELADLMMDMRLLGLRPAVVDPGT